TATTVIYTLSLHDALPIYMLDDKKSNKKEDLLSKEYLVTLGSGYYKQQASENVHKMRFTVLSKDFIDNYPHLFNDISKTFTGFRSEEHTSELQSRENLVCS